MIAWPFGGKKKLQRATSASSLPKTFGGSYKMHLQGRATKSADDVTAKVGTPTFALNETSSRMARMAENDNGGTMQGEWIVWFLQTRSLREFVGDTGLDFDFAVAK